MTTNTMSEELKEFYKQLIAWIDANLPEHEYFVTYVGLCSNFSFFAQHHGAYDYSHFTQEMVDQFVAAGLDPRYPFNRDYSGYNTESTNDICYLNPKRIAFVRENAK